MVPPIDYIPVSTPQPADPDVSPIDQLVSNAPKTLHFNLTCPVIPDKVTIGLRIWRVPTIHPVGVERDG